MARRIGFGIFCFVLAFPAAVLAGPLTLEEKARIATPDPTYDWPVRVAIDGDWIVATGSKYLTEGNNLRDNSAWLYRRQSNGSWRLVRRLLQWVVEEDGDEPNMVVAMQGGVAAILKEDASWIFEQAGSDWVAVNSPMVTDGMDVEVRNGTIVVSAGHCDWIANAYRKNSTGAWQLMRSTEGEGIACENEDDRGDVDVSGSTIIVATFGDGSVPHSARIFEGAFGTTATMTRLVAPEGNPWAFGRPVALENDSALVGGEVGLHAYTRDPSHWFHSGSLLRPDNLTLGSASNVKAKLLGGRAVIGELTDPLRGLRAGSVSVFQRAAGGTYRYVARLLASDGAPEAFLGQSVGISGSRVVASSVTKKTAYVFELPTDLSQPATQQDTFEDGNASTWTFIPGSSFSVVSLPASKVLRQSSVTGGAGAFLGNTDWRNQAVEADIRPTFFESGGERWFGLLARFIDTNNYYYVTVRNTHTVQLKKMVNGVYTTLASAPLSVALNRNYRLRLEAVGTRVRVFVNGALAVEARDSAIAQGRAGLYMYKTKADYDNIVVSANPNTTLASQRFGGEEDNSYPSWELLGTWATTQSGADSVYAQTTVTGASRAITGIVVTDDQIVEARIKPTGSAAGDTWFGLATRYRDAGNYYYVTLRKNNIVALRKLVNGTIVELDRATLSVPPNVWHRVRFDAVGDQLRVYVNDALIVEATDSTYATGRYGVLAYKTAVHLDDLLARQP